jgi:hypothetical protein
MLICALIVPRVAWGAHEAGHDQPMASMVEHVHHDGHSHQVIVDSDDQDLVQHDDRDGGLVHDHLPADVLSAMADVDAGQVAGKALFFASQHLLDRNRIGHPSAAPDSLLRPPRTA